MAAARLADVLVGDLDPAVRARARRSSLEQLAVAPPRRRPRRRARRGRRAGAARARRGPARARRVESTRGPPTAATRNSSPRRGKAEAKSSPSCALERARSGGAGRRARGARSSASRPAGSPGPAPAAVAGAIASLFEHVGHAQLLRTRRRRPESNRRSSREDRRRPATAPPRRAISGTPGDPDRDQQRARRSCGSTPRPSPMRPEQQRQRPLGVGDHQRARRAARRAGPRAARRSTLGRIAERALDAVGVEGAQRRRPTR